LRLRPDEKESLMKIDCHIHAIPERVLALLRRDSTYRVTLDGNRWRGGNYVEFDVTSKWYDPDVAFAGMQANGIDIGVLSAAPKPLFYYDVELEPAKRMCRETNLGLAEFSTAKPDHFRWMAHLPLRYPEAAVEMLHEAADAGCCGVLAGTNIAGRRLDEADYGVFWSAVQSLKLPVFLHPGYEHPNPGLDDYYLQSIIGMPTEATIAIERLICSGVLDRYPDVRVVCALGGGFFPYQVGRLRQCISYRPELKDAAKDPWKYVGQIKFDTNLHELASLKFLIEFAGPENVLLGTDLPFATAIQNPMDMLKAAAGSEDAVKKISETNPAMLFNLSS
jgi:aminocarboxymuconate-semialdehyde decarboxylase